MIYNSLKEDYVLQDELIDIIYNAHRDFFTNKEMLKIATAEIIGTIITRDQATKVIPLLKAFAEGKAIQKYINGKWKYIDIISLTDLYASIKNYRIKDTSSTIVYKPFIDKTECIAEMQHHKQFGWIKHKDEQRYYSIVEIMDNQLLLVGTSKFSGRVCDFEFNFKEAFNHFRFLDGTPFGVKCKQNDI
jgi:hypothetical protein